MFIDGIAVVISARFFTDIYIYIRKQPKSNKSYGRTETALWI